jgi:hypothetical protein
MATVAGWGRTGYNQPQSKVLKSVQVQVLKNPECNKKFSPNFGGIQPYHLCGYAKGIRRKMNTVIKNIFGFFLLYENI